MIQAKQAHGVPRWAVLVLLASTASLAWLHLPASQDGGQVPHRGHVHEDPDIARGRKVLPHPLEEVAQLVLRHDGNGMRVRRAGPLHRHAQPGAWLVQGDGAGSAPPAAELAMRLAAFSRLRMEKEYPPLPEREREFGLAGETGTLDVEVLLGNGEMLHIRFGDLAPDGISRYVRLSQPALLATVPDFHYRSLVGLIAPDSVRQQGHLSLIR